MITVVIKRNDEPTVIQMTQENIVRELSEINGAEMLLEDSWAEGLRKVRTPFVCLVEADCVLSANYLPSNVGLMQKTLNKGYSGDGAKGGDHGGGGYTKLAMLASCIGVGKFDNRVYDYQLSRTWSSKATVEINGKRTTLQTSRVGVTPNRDKPSTTLYSAQIGFVPGAIIRYSSITDIIDTMPWDKINLVELSTRLSFHFWETNRRVQANPNTTYVSNKDYLEEPPLFDPKVPKGAANIFEREMIGLL